MQKSCLLNQLPCALTLNIKELVLGCQLDKHKNLNILQTYLKAASRYKGRLQTRQKQNLKYI